MWLNLSPMVGARGHQKRTMFEIGRAFQEPVDFGPAQHRGQRLGTFSERHHGHRPGDMDRVRVQKRVTIKVAPKKLKTFKQRIKELTGRSRGISMASRPPTLRVGARDLNRYVRGWIGYFGLARQFDDIADLDGCRVSLLATRGVEFGCATGNSGVILVRRFVTWCGLA